MKLCSFGLAILQPFETFNSSVISLRLNIHQTLHLLTTSFITRNEAYECTAASKLYKQKNRCYLMLCYVHPFLDVYDEESEKIDDGLGRPFFVMQRSVSALAP
jgi:hypothetical protein